MEEISYRETHRVQSSHWWYQARLKVISAVLEKYLQHNKQGTLLEIGAGSGVNLPVLRRFGRVDAVEMHEGGRGMIEEAFPDVNLRDGALPDKSLFGGLRYDAICLFDVLEHVEPHVEALEVIRDHVNEDGRVFLTVPAYQWLWSQHDVAMHHYRRYTRRSLTEALESAGWQIDQIGYFNTFLFPLALAARLKDRIFRPQISTGIALPARGANQILYKILSSEANRVRRSGYSFGLSLMAVATPRRIA